MTTRHISTPMAFAAVLTIGVTVPSIAVAATVGDASAALAFWMSWGVAYLGLGAVLLAVAAAIGIRERRAWSSLLHWTADDLPFDEPADTRPRRAA